MGSFNDFQNILPDPNNVIGDAGQATGTAGPGYASVKLSSENQTIRSKTNSGRLISRASAYHTWKVNINYNPMTQADFNRIYSFLIHRRGSIDPFFVSLPQYRTPQDSTFASYAQSNNLGAAASFTAGSTNVLLEKTGYNHGTNKTPTPGDLFTISGANSNHKKAYMVTRVMADDYHSDNGAPATNQVRIHFTPGLAKTIANADGFVFHNPLIRVIAKDLQEYQLGTNNLYQFGLSLEEVQ